MQNFLISQQGATMDTLEMVSPTHFQHDIPGDLFNSQISSNSNIADLPYPVSLNYLLSHHSENSSSPSIATNESNATQLIPTTLPTNRSGGQFLIPILRTTTNLVSNLNEQIGMTTASNLITCPVVENGNCCFSYNVAYYIPTYAVHISPYIENPQITPPLFPLPMPSQQVFLPQPSNMQNINDSLDNNNLSTFPNHNMPQGTDDDIDNDIENGQQQYQLSSSSDGSASISGNQSNEKITLPYFKKVHRVNRTLPKTFTPRKNSENGNNSPSLDNKFFSFCFEAGMTINPHEIGFIPKSYWENRSYLVGVIIRDFFFRKNHPCCRFYHKLYNALKLSEEKPEWVDFIGAKWVSNDIIQISGSVFGRLLGIKSYEGSLFHQQGNFPSFGFEELDIKSLKSLFSAEYINEFLTPDHHFLTHKNGAFRRDSVEEDFITGNCKWVGIRQREKKKL